MCSQEGFFGKGDGMSPQRVARENWPSGGKTIKEMLPLTYCFGLSILVAGTIIYYHWEAMLISYLATRVIALPFKSLEGS